MRTVGIAWSAQLNVLRMFAIVHFPSSGGIGVSLIFLQELTSHSIQIQTHQFQLIAGEGLPLMGPGNYLTDY